MREHAVVIVGGGPTGLMLAGELALASVDVAIVERRENQDIVGARAGGLHARTIEVLDQRGIADRFLSQGQVAQVAGFAWIRLDISDFPTRHKYGLALGQTHIERILAGWVGELAVPIYRGQEVTAIAQDDTGVDVALADGRSLRAEYLVGCDGGRSLVRKTAGIDFPGWDPAISNLIAEAELAQEPEWGIRRDARGIHSLSRSENGGAVRILVTEQRLDRTGEPTLRDLSEALVAVYGTDYGVHSKRFAGMMSGLDIRYEFGEGHPLLGRRMPDLDVITADGPLRVFALLRDARPVLLNFGEPGGLDVRPWADRVRKIDAEYDGPWELPVLGAVTAPSAVLIRPDGYVAWVADSTKLGLADALTTWFGPPAVGSISGTQSRA
jgi:2-polyprenyl-6-methoxyphenol hydroxylase-like FAD-dependent oxidoreductase